MLKNSHRFHHHTYSCAIWIEDREHCRCFVRWLAGMIIQPVTEHIVLVLGPTSGATETAWLSDTRPYRQLWALHHHTPLRRTRSVFEKCQFRRTRAHIGTLGYFTHFRPDNSRRLGLLASLPRAHHAHGTSLCIVSTHEMRLGSPVRCVQ